MWSITRCNCKFFFQYMDNLKLLWRPVCRVREDLNSIIWQYHNVTHTTSCWFPRSGGLWFLFFFCSRETLRLIITSRTTRFNLNPTLHKIIVESWNETTCFKSDYVEKSPYIFTFAFYKHGEILFSLSSYISNLWYFSK